MKAIFTTTAVLMSASGMAEAGGVDRSGQSIGIIFEQGNYLELSYGSIRPKVSGRDIVGPLLDSQNVAGDHNLPGIALKYQLNDKLALGLIYGQDYGADIYYPSMAEGGSLLLGGTSAQLDSDVVTAILRYRFDDSWSAHGGIRASHAAGKVRLAGAAYAQGPISLDDYNVTFDGAWGAGFLVGGAYEIPDIALRVAVTYFSKVGHDLDTVEYFPVPLPGGIPAEAPLASVTTVDTPQAVNIDIQSGVAKDTLVFGAIRWVDWSAFQITPQVLGSSLTDLEDSITYTLGVGRRFNDQWSGSVFLTYEKASDAVISPLAPNNGYKGIGFGVVYSQDNMKVTLGARYLDIGDAKVGPAGNHVADFAGNDAVAVGLKVGFSF